MEILSQLAEVNLTEILAASLKDNLGLHLKWSWDENYIDGQDHGLYYVEIIKNEANAELLKQFMYEWNPIYEQLCLQHDYISLRAKLVAKDSYDLINNLDEYLHDAHVPYIELWMDSTERGQIIAQLDDTHYEKCNITKSHMHYLAINISSTAELYKLIEQKMTQNGILTNSTSDQSQLQINQSFQILNRALNQYRAKQENEIIFCLIGKLEDLYIWLKGLFTAVQWDNRDR
ncbi:hypothetical protein [Ureibacillus acetophenoni]